MTAETETFSPLRWQGGVLELIDQLALPLEESWIACVDEAAVADAIKRMVVRGAPAIGCAAAYGVALAAKRLAEAGGRAAFEAGVDAAIEQLSQTRPTAVNLFWALERMRKVMSACAKESSPSDTAARLEREAIAIHREDIELCYAIGRNGEPLVDEGATVLTHCNAGALATGGYGTALGVIRAAHAAGKKIRVLADETRPYLQGARLTAWELSRDHIDVTLLPDSAAPFLLSRREIDCVVVGADRIAANGDVANKIGTYSLALAARESGTPFYVAAPFSTIDLATASGADIPIEERGGIEMVQIGGHRIAPEGVPARYPAFDVTPAALVSAIITDRGVARAPYGPALAEIVGAGK